MRICLFEDELTLNLLPLNYLRHSSEIICGAFTLLNKFKTVSPESIRIDIHSANYRKKLVSENIKNTAVNDFKNDDYLFLNSRLIYSEKFLNELINLFNKLSGKFIIKGKTIIAGLVSKNKIGILTGLLNKKDNFVSAEVFEKAGLKKIDIKRLKSLRTSDFTEINYHFETINLLNSELDKDLTKLFKHAVTNSAAKHKNADVINKENIYISPKVNILPGVVIDASDGKVYISDNVKIEPFTYIKGPVYIGKNTTIRSGSHLYGPLSIGDNCKISGEIINSVFMSYVNKQHYGFVGHSYLCSWVNLGAGTTTSNLKNNYSTIRVKWNNEETDTKTIFLGSIIGDFTKTGINTMLNTGSIIGISSNVFGGGYQDKYIKSFEWVEAGKKEHMAYEFKKASHTAKISMERRGKKLSNYYREAMLYIFRNQNKFPI